MNDILTRQNEAYFLKLLAAQRQIYNEEKRWFGIWIILTTIITVVGSGALALIQPINAMITLIILLWVIGDIFALYSITKRGKDAARIQELFDCELLELPWNEFLAKKPEESIIDAAATRYATQASPADKARLPDWYSKGITGMPMHVARVACQQENLLWDEKQRREYVTWIGIALLILALILVVISILANWPAREFFTGPLLIMVPIFAMGVKHGYEHYKAINRLTELIDSCAKLLQETSTPEVDPETMKQRSRELQNEIFRHRAENPPVFNWFYERIREKYERRFQS